MRNFYRTALVTGASSGIGEHIARAAANVGADVVVVARRTGRLEALAAQLRDTCQVSVEVLTADLLTAAGLEAVKARVADPDRPVELVVNNAGYGIGGAFADLDEAGIRGQIGLNVGALVEITWAALPAMLAARHGGVLNVSSMASMVALPGSVVYSATKAFVTSFSEGLAAEVADRGVHVTALCPGFTRTEFHDSHAEPPQVPGFAWLDAAEVARAGLEAVAAGRPLSVPGAQYRAAAGLMKVLPRAVIRRAASSGMRRQEGHAGG